MKTIRQRTEVTEDYPSQLLLLRRPPGVSLVKWVKSETGRLKETYPEIKESAKELGPEAAEMLRTAKYNRDLWSERYELVKLEIREQLGWAKKGTASDIPFIERRKFTVRDYHVNAYDEDALYPLS
jgi:hypothetical protein